MVCIVQCWHNVSTSIPGGKDSLSAFMAVYLDLMALISILVLAMTRRTSKSTANCMRKEKRIERKKKKLRKVEESYPHGQCHEQSVSHISL